MTDLKAAAEAAKAATAAYIADPTDRETGRQWDRACAEFNLACTEDAILALIRERDEARERAVAAEAREHNAHLAVKEERAIADAAEAALSAAQEEVARMQRWLSYVERELVAAMERGQLHHSLHVLVTGTQDPTDG